MQDPDLTMIELPQVRLGASESEEAPRLKTLDEALRWHRQRWKLYLARYTPTSGEPGSLPECGSEKASE